MSSASEPAALMVKNAALKDVANQVVIKLGYARGMKEEQLEVVVAFCLEVTFLPLFLLDLGRVACLPFAFELLGETEEKPIVVVVTPLTAIICYEGPSSRDVFYPH